MIIIFFILLTILIVIIYYEARVVKPKIPKEIFKNFDFLSEKFMNRDVFVIEPKNEKSKITILYIHGGSYVGELERYHWQFFKDIVQDAKARIIVPDYPLAPEKTYIDVFKMMKPLYEEIINKLTSDDKFILMGDSAGAGMALALYQKIGKLNHKLPDKTILISPWIDVRMNNPEIDNIDDPILKKYLLKLSGKKYAGKNGMKSYLVNPIIGPVDKLKNIFILIGTRDLLNPDAKLFANSNKNTVNFYEYLDATHNFVLMKHKPKVLYAKEGYKRVVDIILE